MKQLVLSYIIEQHFLESDVDFFDLIPITSQTLFEIVDEWKKQMPFQPPIFESLDGVDAAMQFLGLCYYQVSKYSENIISNYDIYKSILDQKYIKENKKIRGMLVRKIIQHMSCVFDCPYFAGCNNETPNERLSIMMNVTKNIEDIVTKNLANREFYGHKTWDVMFQVIFGIIDMCIKNNFFCSISLYNIPGWLDKISEFVKKLIDLSISIQVVNSKKTMLKYHERWEKWSENKIFTRIWCELFIQNGKLVIDGEEHYRNYLKIFSPLLRFEIALNLPDFIEQYTSCLKDFSVKIYETFKYKQLIYVPKFQVNVILDFLIVKSILVLESKLDRKLLLATIYLLSLSGFDENTFYLLKYFIKKLNLLIEQFLASQTSKVDVLDFLATNEFQAYFRTSNDVFSIIPQIKNYFVAIPEEEKIKFEIFTFAHNLSAFNSFQVPINALRSYYTYNVPDDVKVKAILSSIWTLMVYSGHSFIPQFNKIFDELTNVDDELIVSLYILLISLPYVSSIPLNSFFGQHNKSTFLSITEPNIIEKLNKNEILCLQIAMIEIFANGLLIPNIYTNIINTKENPEILSIIKQISFPRIRSTFPEIPKGSSFMHFGYHGDIYSINTNETNPFVCQVIVRDKYGTSVLELKELLTNHSEMPKMENLPEALIHNEPDPKIKIDVENVVINIQEPETVSSDNSDKIENDTLPPFFPTKVNRPILFEVLRSLNFIHEPKEITIMDENSKINDALNELDCIYSIPIIPIPVYYADKSTKNNFSENWNEEILDKVKNYISLFCYQENSHFYCSTKSVIFEFVPFYQYPSNIEATSSLIINETGLSLSSNIGIKSQTVISISALGHNLFEIVLEKIPSIYQFALGNVTICSSSHVKGHFVYILMNQLLSQKDPTLFRDGINKRKDKIKSILTEFGKYSAEQFLCDYKN